MILTNFESFNARNLTPEEVAGTFIPSQDYEDLWRNDHTVVLGPRGSGKTTLFKMLTVQALHTWDSPVAQVLRTSRLFTAIYVPTDMHWHLQLRHTEGLVSGSPKLQMVISRCAVTTSILLAVVRTFQDRLFYEADPAPENETAIAKELIDNWKLDRTLPTFDMISLRLKSRISDIRSWANASAFRENQDALISSLPDYFHLDYFAAIEFACKAFDTILKLPQSKKWALCFDEMELSPEWLQNLVLSEMRSSDQNFLIKISTSPIPLVTGITGPQPKQDFQLISIWNHSGRDSESFSQQLATSLIQRKFGNAITPFNILGEPKLNSLEKFEINRYERESSEWHLFKNLALWDQSFRSLLIDNGLDPENPVTDDISIRDQILRKAKPIAIFRSALLKNRKNGGYWFRSRKITGLYFGSDAVFRISDGNPRRLIGIINNLLSKVSLDNNGKPLQLSPNEQEEILTKASSQFLGYVNALPGGSAMLDHERFLDLATILKTIASYFRQDLLGETFQLDPKGSFTVDSNLNQQIVDLIRLGVYHGAIVHVDPLPDTIETSVVGKRFRLSYMLAPISRLSLNLYSSVSLSRILKSSSRIRVKRALSSLEQANLPI